MTDLRIRFEQEALPHLDAAYNLARWLCRSAAEAEDVVQEALLLAFRNFSGQRGPNTKAWLLTIVRNSFVSGARRGAVRRRLTDPLEVAESAAVPAALVSPDDPEREAIGEQQAQSVDAVLGSLSAEFREVLVLRELEGFSYDEIARIAGIPVGTVMSRLARARAAFRSEWQRTTGGADDALS